MSILALHTGECRSTVAELVKENYRDMSQADKDDVGPFTLRWQLAAMANYYEAGLISCNCANRAMPTATLIPDVPFTGWDLFICDFEYIDILPVLPAWYMTDSSGLVNRPAMYFKCKTIDEALHIVESFGFEAATPQQWAFNNDGSVTFQLAQTGRVQI